MNNKKDWQMKDMLEYAKDKYSLIEGYNKNGNYTRVQYEKQIRRTMRNYNMVKENENGKYTYRLPEKKAKYLIDVILKSYFEKYTDEELIKQKCYELDKKHNEDNRKAIEEWDPTEEYNDEGVGGEEFYYPTIEKIIDREMLHAIFNLFYEFDEKSFKEDYEKRKHLVSNNDSELEPYMMGHTYEDLKLNNFVKYYCKRKKNK